MKSRVLQSVRTLISTESSTYICWALDDIAAQDHRRKIQAICDEIKNCTLAHISPYKSFGDFVLATAPAASLSDVREARLAWLDRLILEMTQD